MNSEFAAAKDVDGPQPSIHLAPSQILGFEFTERHRTEEYAFNNADGQQEARLAAVEVGGQWFALDGARLEYYQRLERDGNCRRVTVEPVPATQLSDETRSKIAETLASDKNNAMSLNDPLIRGYESLDELDRNSSSTAMLDSMTGAVDDTSTDDPDTSNSSSSSSSDGDDSSSECGSHYLDWSEDERDSSEDESEEEEEDEDDDGSFGPKQRPSADRKSTDASSGDDNAKLLGAAEEEEA